MTTFPFKVGLHGFFLEYHYVYHHLATFICVSIGFIFDETWRPLYSVFIKEQNTYEVYFLKCRQRFHFATMFTGIAVSCCACAVCFCSLIGQCPGYNGSVCLPLGHERGLSIDDNIVNCLMLKLFRQLLGMAYCAPSHAQPPLARR